MKRFEKVPFWYSVISCSVALFIIAVIIFKPSFAWAGQNISTTLNEIIFFLFFVCFINCLPFAIVSIFLATKKKTLKLAVINFVIIILFLYQYTRVVNHIG